MGVDVVIALSHKPVLQSYSKWDMGLAVKLVSFRNIAYGSFRFCSGMDFVETRMIRGLFQRSRTGPGVFSFPCYWERLLLGRWGVLFGFV